MSLEDLGDSFKEQWSTILTRLQESQLYNNIREKYEVLPAQTQQILRFAGSLLVAFFIFMIPYSFYSSSRESENFFNLDRDVLRRLQRAKKLQDENRQSPLPQFKNAEQIETSVRAALATMPLNPDQIGTMEPTAELTQLAAQKIKQSALLVNLKTLNVEQIIDISYELQRGDGSIKMIDMDIIASPILKDYFDVTYKLVSFSLGIEEDFPVPRGGGDGERKPFRPPPKQGPPEESEEDDGDEVFEEDV